MSQWQMRSEQAKTPGLCGGDFRSDQGFCSRHLVSVLLVAPTGVDPVTFRFSVERSTN